MRDKFYFGFAIFLLTIFLILVILHSALWFLVLAIPLCLIYLYDITQTKHSILRNFPVLGHLRFIFEFVRPEIQQYFIANDQAERPYDRETRSLIYERSKKARDSIPFGTQRNILAQDYEWVLHSMNPKPASEVEHRIMIGNDDCKQPYSSSRLNISSMSFGALSANAVIAMNLGAKIGHFAQSTGEGGLSPYHLQGGDLVWQIGTGYFGCRDDKGLFSPDLFKKESTRPEVKMIELKVSQGAKPAHGGILPAAKLTNEIAKIRKVPLGQDVLSPPKHSAFSTPIEMMRFIQELKDLSGGKPVGFKLCLGYQTEFLAICKAMLETKIYPDFITIDGAEGGTGAAPIEFTNHVGMPLNYALNFIHLALVGTGLRDKICLIVSGKIATGFDMVAKIALGADVCNMARAMMMATGCIQSRQCNMNTCPTGVATQDQRLQKGLVVKEKKHRVANFHEVTLHSFRELIGAMGLCSASELSPHYVIRRTESGAQSYADIYHGLGRTIKSGDFLADRIPDFYAHYWKEAQADKF